MSVTTVNKKFYVDGALTDVSTSITLGVIRTDTLAEVVAAGTAMTKAATGTYYHAWTDPASGLTYTVTYTIVHSGETYIYVESATGGTSATEPVTLAEAKSHLRITSSDDDTYITTLITVARKWAESYTGRQFLTATKYKYYDTFPSEFALEYPPFASVTSVTYYDENESLQTLAATEYDVDITSAQGALRGRIVPAYESTWPSTYDKPNAVIVTYVSGYGAAGSSVPEGIRHAILMMIAHWYENREPVSDVTMKEVPLAAKALLDFYRVWPL